MLETLNETILSNTETEGIEDDIVETDIYMMYLRMKLDKLIAERDQRETSLRSQQPTFHPMDTRRGREDTGVGGQQTTFRPSAQRDQRDTSIGSQQSTFHPMDTQRDRGDTGIGGQQTTFHPLDAQRDQADTRLEIQQTFNPDDTPTTLEIRNTHYIIQSIPFI
ncbi:hypothetical protein DPMN_180381 [Dreissena polymorpha]|uniref:Uncharacterized protein n=1 Tax=Dreissena polymorpha TaxID=45954 RepID=A0A9D4EGT5_DREPO|nr:hypothetical protein DPMN_180381 [Dreissena polymorpha]